MAEQPKHIEFDPPRVSKQGYVIGLKVLHMWVQCGYVISLYVGSYTNK